MASPPRQDCAAARRPSIGDGKFYSKNLQWICAGRFNVPLGAGPPMPPPSGGDTLSRQQNASRRYHDRVFKQELAPKSVEPRASVSAITLRGDVSTNRRFKWRRDLRPVEPGTAAIDTCGLGAPGAAPAEPAGRAHWALGL